MTLKNVFFFKVVKDYKLGFVGLQETRNLVYRSSSLLNSLVGTYDFLPG
jgi:hypothetical protein